jgi:prepilin-type N-terminal cleavage/methylation domain-containing protein
MEMVVRKPRGAYTLFELVMVLAIVVILAAMAYPTLNGMVGNKGLSGKPGVKAALDEIRGKLAEAKARAAEDGRPYRFGIVPGTGNYRIAPDSDEFWGGSGGSTSSSNSRGKKPLVRAGALPAGSRFCKSENASCPGCCSDGNTSQAPDQVAPTSYEGLVTFLPDGTAKADGRITLVTDEARPVILQIQASMGNVITQEE